MVKNIIRILFWFTFFAWFVYFLAPKFKYLFEGIPEYMGKTSFIDRMWFIVHIVSGAIVYITGVFQFLPSFRNRHLSTHRKMGKLFIFASLVCILSLYFVIPANLCSSCRPSQYVDTTLWLIFVSLAFYFAKKRKITIHQRFMVSSFICASYFVTVRLIDRFGMGLFNRIAKNEDAAFLYSDIAAWLVPLVIVWSFWVITDTKKSKLAV